MMMGSETTEHTFGSPTRPQSPPSLPDEMETLNLSDVYKSAISSSSSSSSSVTITNSSIHSLPPITTSEPLISHQPQSPPRRNPKSPNSSPFLDPPSYADVVFSPFHNSNNDNGNGDSASASSSSSTARGISSFISERPPRSSSIYREISVSDPRKVQDSSNTLVTSTYVTYLITTRTSDTEYKVRRRFRDVVTLSDRLSEAYRGFFIPVRPDKGVVESQMMQQQDFVKQRRLALEKYLRRLSVHPVIEKSMELGIFLQVDGKLQLPMTTDVASRMLDGAVRLPKQLFGEVREGCVAQHEVAQPAKGGRDLLRIFKELKQSMTNDWSGTKPSVVEEDKQFLEMKEKVQDLEQQLSTSSQQAEGLVKAQQDICETMRDLGFAFVNLTKFETENTLDDFQKIRAAEIRRVATAAVKASRFYQELTSQTVKHLDTLHEYLGMMLAIRGAFLDRTNALLTVQTLLSDLNSFQLKAEKLEAASSKIFGGDRSRLRKVEELKETIRITDDAKKVALGEYERIKENNKTELERLDKEKRGDFLDMLKGFVVNQVGYAERIATVWEQAAEETSVYAKQ